MMAEQLSKLIMINGPSLSGKTRLSLIITSFLDRLDIPVSNISFEILYNTICNNYEESFYSLVKSRLAKNNIVIAESVLFNSMPNQPALEILCLPDINGHQKMYNEYVEKFGEDDAKRRIYYNSVKLAREKFSRTYTYGKDSNRLIYNSDLDLKNICEKVLEYVKA